MIRSSAFRQFRRPAPQRFFLFAVGVPILTVAGCPSSTGVLSETLSAAAVAKPTVTVPESITVECDGNGNQEALQQWLNSATFTEGCGGATLTHDFVAFPYTCGAAGEVTVTWTVADRCGGTASDSSTFTIVDTRPPKVTVPAPLTLSCGDADAGAVFDTWIASAASHDACGNVLMVSTISATSGCTGVVTWTATDACGNQASRSSTYTIDGDAAPPTLTLIGEAAITVECGEIWSDPGATAADDCDPSIQPAVEGAVDPLTPGTYTLTYSASDLCGNEAEAITRTVTVLGSSSPVVTVNPPTTLWPPNHRLITFSLADLVRIEGGCAGSLDPNEVGEILEIYSDEPDAETGGGDTTGDIVISDSHTFALRAERRGNGNGRVYGIRFQVAGSDESTTEWIAYIHVPHDQSGRAAVDDGPGAGQVVTR